MRKRYIDLMEKALSAYTNDHLRAFCDKEKKEGISDHSFARLTANIGILITHGRRKDLLPLFLEMMDFCCYCTPRFKIESDFSVREIVNCIEAVEKAKIVETTRVDTWKREIASIQPYECYTRIAKDPDEVIFNWALFTAVSEYRRNVAGLGETAEIIDIQLATQLKHLDENGMYRDGIHHAPVVYDLVARGLFAILLHLGYRGKYRNAIDEAIKKAALHTLKMQSVSGEIPFGGRSNQFIHNEAWLSLILEYEATRYKKMGNLALAGKFKAAANRAVDVVERWLSTEPIYHIKNRYPTESKYGCEKYAHFNGYMIAVASFLHEAYLICDDSIAATAFDVTTPVAWQTSEYFHAAYLRAGGYALQFDTVADVKYDANGLGRVHRKGAPSALCMSLSCPATPNFTVDIPSRPLSLCAGVREESGWHFVCDGDVTYALSEHRADGEVAVATMAARFESGKQVTEHYTVSKDGVEIALCGTGKIAYLLPALTFDGEMHTEIRTEENALCVTYQGWTCRYVTNGEIIDLGYTAPNRNGHYRAFAATGKDVLRVKIKIFRRDKGI